MILPAKIADWPVIWRERYEERAGIIEVYARFPRERAEKLAESDTRRMAEKEAA